MQKLLHPHVSRVAAFGRAGSCPSAPVGFTSDAENGVVYESDSTGVICATLTGFSEPLGLSIDHQGNVYVANIDTSSIVEVNASTGVLVNIFNDPGEFPIDVAVDNNGDLAVTNEETTSFTAGNILFYANGSTNPTGMASNPDYTSPRFCAFDKKGDLDFDDNDNFNTFANNVGVVFAGNMNNMAAVVHPLNGASIEFPGGVQVLNTSGKYGTLTILDEDGQGPGNGGTIDTYNSFSYPNLGPATITTLSGSTDPVGDAFSPAGGLVVVADVELGQADLYKFPSGVLIRDYTAPNSGELFGAGIDPTEQFTLR